MNMRSAYQAAFCASHEKVLISNGRTKQLLDATQGALDLLNYTREEIQTLHIHAVFDQLSDAKIERITSGEEQEWVMTALHDSNSNKKNHHETERALSAALDISPYAIVIAALDGTYLKVNQPFCRITGYKEKDIIGTTFLTSPLYIPGERPYVDVMKELMQTGTVRKQKTRIRHANSDERTLLYSSSKIHYHGQECILSITFDITELTYNEKLLRLERDLGFALSRSTSLNDALQNCLDTAMEATEMDSGGLYLVNEQSGDLDLALHHGLSPKFIETVQHYPAHSYQAQWAQEGHPIYLDSDTPNPFEDLMRREGLQVIAILPILSNGKTLATLHLASKKKPIFSSYSRFALESIAGHIGSAISRIRAETATKQKNNALSTLINNVPGIVFTIAAFPPWYAEFMNDEVEVLTGHSIKEFLEKQICIQELILPEDIPYVRNTINQAFQNHSSYTMEYRIRHANGSIRWFFEKGSPSYDSEGHPLAINGVILDITEGKRAEEAAESAHRIKSEFLDIAAHELRTPLAVLSSLLQHRQKERLTDRLDSDFLDRLTTQVTRLERLTNDLLNVSRLEKGRKYAANPSV